jgi:hypothetical protein
MTGNCHVRFLEGRVSAMGSGYSIPLALLSFGLSLVRGVSAGCDQPLLLAGPSRRYLCESLPECLGPCHGGPVECTCLFLPPRHRPSPVPYRGLPAFPRQNDFITDRLFETAAISLCSGPQVCSPPRSFPPLAAAYRRRAAEAFTSELNMLRCLRMHRIC